jgi:hypothetical protein
MIKDYNLIETIIREAGAEDKANLIKSALEKEVNSSVIESEYTKRKEASEDRFSKAKAVYEKELEIYNNSNYTNSEIVLDKHIKSIITKLKALGF